MSNCESRLLALKYWLEHTASIPIKEIQAIQNDASHRRYFRIHSNENSLIAMDAPPEKEDCRPFVAIANGLLDHGVSVPKVHAQDFAQGFLLLSDLGDNILIKLLNHDTADHLYQLAFLELIKLADCQTTPDYTLPAFDEQHIRFELNLFLEWYLTKYLAVDLSIKDKELLEKVFSLLITNALEQPQVFVHRDYHANNLMVLPNDKIGLLDFQDAVLGPITYDLVSLLKDRYITWPIEKIHAWVRDYYQLLMSSRKSTLSFEQFLRWFDLAGLQRNLKILGIFARLHLRDAKSNYLQFMPRFLNYVSETSTMYPEYHGFADFLTEKVMPRMPEVVL